VIYSDNFNNSIIYHIKDMGCGNSKAGPGATEEIPVADFSKLDRFQRFEHHFPLYRIRIDVFEGKVKRFVTGKNSVTLAQLRYAFKDDKNWEELKNDDSLLVQVLKSEFFEDEKNPGEINIHSLILWGILLCPGTNQLKARVFYDVLQDALQETISAGDKDFPESFNKLIELATKLVYRFEQELDAGVEKVPEDKVDDDLLDKIRESFLDEVFGSSSKLTRKEYMDQVATK
jgi:hypothetical protein